MARFLHRNFSVGFRKYAQLALAFFWCFGLILGAALSSATGHSLSSMTRMAASAPASVVGLIASLYLPFLFSAFAVYCSLPGLMYGVCFCKAVALAFVSCGAADAFGSAGWLARFLLMFGDILACGVLYWYAGRHISGVRPFSTADFGGCTGILALLLWLDYSGIAPFFAGIV